MFSESEGEKWEADALPSNNAAEFEAAVFQMMNKRCLVDGEHVGGRKMEVMKRAPCAGCVGAWR